MVGASHTGGQPHKGVLNSLLLEVNAVCTWSPPMQSPRQVGGGRHSRGGLMEDFHSYHISWGWWFLLEAIDSLHWWSWKKMKSVGILHNINVKNSPHYTFSTLNLIVWVIFFFLTTTTTLLNQIIIDNGWPSPQIARKKLIEAGQAKYKNTPIKDKLTQQQLV